MTDDFNFMPEIPAEAAEHLINTAAQFSGIPAAELDLERAMQILQGKHPDPATDAFLNQFAEQATEAIFSNITDDMAGDLLQALTNGDLKEPLEQAMQELTKQLTPAADQTDNTPIKKKPSSSEAAALAAELAPEIEAMQNSAKIMHDSLQGITAATMPGTFAALQEYFNSSEWQNVRETLKEIAAAAPAWIELAEEITELTPYLEAELKKPEYGGLTIDDLLKEAEQENGIAPNETSRFMQALRAAREARNADAEREPLRAAIKRAEIVEYPLDKPNSIIWNLLEEDTKGQVTFNMAKSGSRQNIPAYYAINFDGLSDDLQITKRLLPFDKLAYVAAGALFNAGNDVITLSQIYYAMGYTGTPGDPDREKIYNAITKMRTADIFFDNEQEASKYNYVHFKYEGALLPCEIGEAVINGKKTDKAIHIFREPPLISFAKQRKQITTLDIKLLQAPLSKTDANLRIQDYLLERISKAKNGKGKSCRILFKTLYEHTGIPDKPKTNTEKQQKKRAPGKVEKYLKHYKNEGFISKYTVEKDGVTIRW